MKIRLHKNFEKQFQKLQKGEQRRTGERLATFINNPFHPLLNNHPLKGKYLGYRSINMTGDLRAIYKLISENKAIFAAVDSHSNLYQ